MRLAALLLAGTLALSGCTSDDDPETPVTPTTPNSSSAPTPSTAEVAAADDAVKAAIKARDSAGLASALTEAGRLAGLQAAAAEPTSPLRRDKRLLRAYRVAGWWASEYAKDPEFAAIFEGGRLEPYEELGQDPAKLEDLTTLSFQIQDDWKDQTGDGLSFNDTYDTAFDQELPKQ